jgi:hypothetical protein
MLSEKELRVWVIGTMVLVWVGLGWAITDHFFWSPEGTALEVVQQLVRKAEVLVHGLVALAGVLTLALTRLAYCMLRAPRASGQAIND